MATEAESNYAASGGNEQRPFPWSDSARTLDQCVESRAASR
ncbi:hypothetical protein [Sorangium sp. So ce233]